MTSRPRLSPLARRVVGVLAVLVTVLLAGVGVRTDDVPLAGAHAVPAVAGTGSDGALPAAVALGAADALGADGAPGAAERVAQGEHERAAPRRAARARAGEPALPPVRVHVVERGQTPAAIAERWGVRPRALTRANAHVEPSAVRPGTRLAVPDPSAPSPATPEDAHATRPALARLLEARAHAHDVDPALVKAVAWVESRWDQHVVSDRAAIGVLQVQPATGETVATHLDRRLDLHDVRDNVEAGTAYLAMLEDRYDGDLRAVLAAYHQGPGALDERGVYSSSHRYADEVLRLREVFGGS